MEANRDFEAAVELTWEDQSLVEIAALAEVAAHYSRSALAQLRGLATPSWDRAWFESALALMEEQTEVLGQIVMADRAADAARVKELTWLRVDLTHQKDAVAGPALWGCPISLPA